MRSKWLSGNKIISRRFKMTKKNLHLITLGRYFKFSIAYFLPLFDKSALSSGPFETESMHFYKLLGVITHYFRPELFLS